MLLIDNKIKNFIIDNNLKNSSKIKLEEIDKDMFKIILKKKNSDNINLTKDFLKIYNNSNILLNKYIEKYRSKNNIINSNIEILKENIFLYFKNKNLDINENQIKIINFIKNIEDKINNKNNIVLCSKYCIIKINKDYYYDILNDIKYENKVLNLKINYLGGVICGNYLAPKKRIIISYIDLFDKKINNEYLEKYNINYSLDSNFSYLINNKIFLDINLIICSTLKIYKWIEEIKIINNNYKILFLNEYNELNNIKLKDIKNYDYLIISYDIFNNYLSKNLLKKFKKNELDLEFEINKYIDINNLLDNKLNDNLNIRCLHIFHYKRIIIDGLINIYNTNKGDYYNKLIILLSCNYKWMLNKDIYLNGYNYFLKSINNIVKNIDTVNNKSVLKYIFKNLYSEFNYLENKYNFLINNKLIDFNDFEKNIYYKISLNKYINENLVLKYCSNNNYISLNIIDINHIEKKIIKKKEYDVNSLKKKIDDLKEFKNNNNNNILLNIINKNINIYYNIYEDLNNKNIFYKKNIDFLKKNNNFECPICYEKFYINNLILFNCGHIYCVHCYNELIKNSNKCINCPECRLKNYKKNIIQLINVNKDYISSKFIKIYESIKEIYNNSSGIVIYSKWNDTLKSLKNFLNKYFDNILIKKKDIICNNQNNKNIYLINIVDGLNGINLNNCSDIFFIDYNDNDNKFIKKNLIYNIKKLNNNNNINIYNFLYKNSIEEKYINNII